MRSSQADLVALACQGPEELGRRGRRVERAADDQQVPRRLQWVWKASWGHTRSSSALHGDAAVSPVGRLAPRSNNAIMGSSLSRCPMGSPGEWASAGCRVIDSVLDFTRLPGVADLALTWIRPPWGPPIAAVSLRRGWCRWAAAPAGGKPEQPV